jgi:hypothetical protein
MPVPRNTINNRMRAFELYINEDSSNATIVAKASKSPAALNMAIQGIDAINDAARKAVDIFKSRESAKKAPAPVATPAVKPETPPVNPQPIQNTVESIEEAGPAPAPVDSIAELKAKLNDNAELMKYLKFQAGKGDKQATNLVKQLTAKAAELSVLLDSAITQASESYKILDPYLKKMLSRMGSDGPAEVAKMRTIFQKDEIPTNDAIEFLKAAQNGDVIDMVKLVRTSDGVIDSFVKPKLRKTFVKVIGDFFDVLPQATGGNIGPGEVAFTLLGNPVEKVRKGDLMVGAEPNGEKFEIKAGNTTIPQTKKGAGTPKLSGAILGGDKIPTGKSAWPAVKKILDVAGFTDTEVADTDGKPYPNYRLNNVGMKQFNDAIIAQKIPTKRVAQAFSDIINILYPSVWDENVLTDITEILKRGKGKIVLATVKPGEAKALENNNDLMRYITSKALETYKQDVGKDNFIFFNKTTRTFKVLRGDEFNQDLSDPSGKLKVIRGIDWNDGAYKASPGLMLF